MVEVGQTLIAANANNSCFHLMGVSAKLNRAADLRDGVTDDTAAILRALRIITDQLLAIEERLETLELRSKATLLDVVMPDTESDTSSEGYESAPPSFSYTNNLL